MSTTATRTRSSRSTSSRSPVRTDTAASPFNEVDTKRTVEAKRSVSVRTNKDGSKTYKEVDEVKEGPREGPRDADSCWCDPMLWGRYRFWWYLLAALIVIIASAFAVAQTVNSGQWAALSQNATWGPSPTVAGVVWLFFIFVAAWMQYRFSVVARDNRIARIISDLLFVVNFALIVALAYVLYYDNNTESALWLMWFVLAITVVLTIMYWWLKDYVAGVSMLFFLGWQILFLVYIYDLNDGN